MTIGKTRLVETQCKFEDENGVQCTHLAHCKGWCKPHYEQQRRGFPLRRLLETEPEICEFVDADGVKCDREVFNVRRHLCQLHYEHWRRGCLGGYPDRVCINCDSPFSTSRSDTLTCGPKCSMENSRLKHNYGITGSELNAMLAAQDHKCYTCRRPIQRGGEDRATLFHIDHDHACCPGQKCCGKCLRKLLCFNCNAACGQLNDDPVVARAIADYLEDFHAQRIERLGQGELFDAQEIAGPEVGLQGFVEERAAPSP